MRISLDIAGAGAVTAAGLTAPQTCAAHRASLNGFRLMVLPDPLGAEITVARVPGHWSLRTSPADWLVNLGVRALREAMAGAGQAAAPGLALFLVPPESARGHPALQELPPERMLGRIAQVAGIGINPASRVLDGGAAAALGALAFAARALEQGHAAEVVLLAVDSLLGAADLAALRAARRLLGPDNAQGLIPGEGAVAIRLTPRGRGGAGAPSVLGVATTREPDTVAGSRFSQGRALLTALRGATGDGALEPRVEWVLTNVNGERYAQWEWSLAQARFFRSARTRLPVVHPAMAVGEIGAAGGALGLLIARDAFLRGHAPGRVVLCAAGSDGGLRSAALVAGAG